MKRRIRATVLALALCLALPTLAHGATRYASPTGDDSNTNCPQAEPCDIATALDSSLTSDGDVVTLVSGSYTVSAQLHILDDIVVTGGSGAPPTLIGSVPGQALLRGSSDDSVAFRKLRVINTHESGHAVWLEGGGTLDRVEATAAETGCYVRGPSATILNSICASSGAIGLILQSASAGFEAISVVNATAVGDTEGIRSRNSAGGLLQVDVANTIARTSAAGAINIDVRAVVSPGAAVVIDLASSSYETTGGAGAGTFEINDHGGQQVSAPDFVDAESGDYRQAAGSPTINSGDNSAAQGTVDIDGEPRIQDDTVDIGADERNVPPSVQITSGPANGSRINDPTPAFGWSATDAVAFQCATAPPDILFVLAPCAAPATTSNLSDGQWRFYVQAKDDQGDADVDTRTFTVDTVAPETLITKTPKPRVKTRKRKVRAAFKFEADEAASFQCRLSGRGGWRKCNSPKRYRIRAKRKAKRYVFKVRASDLATNADATPAKYPFKIKRRR